MYWESSVTKLENLLGVLPWCGEVELSSSPICAAVIVQRQCAQMQINQASWIYVTTYLVDLRICNFPHLISSHVNACNQARHDHSSKNLGSRARARRVRTEGIRPRGSWQLTSHAMPPAGCSEEVLSWRHPAEDRGWGCCHDEEKMCAQYWEVEDWATTCGERLAIKGTVEDINAEKETPIFVSGYW